MLHLSPSLSHSVFGCSPSPAFFSFSNINFYITHIKVEILKNVVVLRHHHWARPQTIGFKQSTASGSKLLIICRRSHYRFAFSLSFRPSVGHTFIHHCIKMLRIRGDGIFGFHAQQALPPLKISVM